MRLLMIMQTAVIISGDVNSVEEFIKILKTNNIRCIPLKVSAPFHCSLMKPAAQIMNEKIQNVNLKFLIKKYLLMLMLLRKKILK